MEGEEGKVIRRITRFSTKEILAVKKTVTIKQGESTLTIMAIAIITIKLTTISVMVNYCVHYAGFRPFHSFLGRGRQAGWNNDYAVR